MVLSISINTETESRLRRLADAAGKDVTAYVSQLIEQAIAKPGLDEMLAPLREEFAGSGKTDQQLIDEITAAQTAYRLDRKKTA